MNNKQVANQKRITPKKILIYLIILFMSPVLLVSFLYIIYTGFSISPFLPQDTMALSYLKERYGHDFQIVRSSGGDSLGGSINYSKVAAPQSDPSQEFHIHKCLARCSSRESKEYTDSYPSAIYTHELLTDVKNHAEEFGLTSQDAINVSAWAAQYKSTDTDIFKPGSKQLLSVMDLPHKYNGQTGVGFSVSIKTIKRMPTQDDFNRYAKSITQIRDHYTQKGMAVTFTYTVDPEEEAEDSNERFYRYFVYAYRTKAAIDSKLGETQNVELISTQFTKEKLYKKLTD